MRYHASQAGSRVKPVYLRVLEGIKDELHPISERSNAAGYRENDADVQAMSELAENVRDAIIEYQVSSDLPLAPRVIIESPPSWLNRKRCTSRIAR